MKKLLSLALALTMTASMFTFNAGATDFTDDDSITYAEAVDVISTIGVVDGYSDDSFRPDATLTRGAAAKIICNLVLGPTRASALKATVAPFPDVPVDHTFAGYITYCAQQGIISGNNGLYEPSGTLSSYAFMKMLLGALGYNAETERFVGANWSINVGKQALGIGLADGLEEEFEGSKAVTREEACLYAFNTLNATMVEYPDKTTVETGNSTVTISGVAQDVEWGTGTLQDGNIKSDKFVQFAEEYFKDLVAKEDTDDFGRPATTWSFKKTDIGTYVNKEELTATYTDEVEGGTVYTDIGSVACDFDLTAYVDGVEDADYAKEVSGILEKKNDDELANSGRGVLTEVYVDIEDEETTVVHINTYLGQMVSDYSEKNENSKVSVYVEMETDGEGNNVVAVGEKIKTKVVELENVSNLADFEEDDFVLVTMADGVVKSLADPEVVEEVGINTFATNNSWDETTGSMMKYVTTEDATYWSNVNCVYDYDVLTSYTDLLMANGSFNLFMDPYGYVIGLELVEADDNYVFVVGYEGNSYVLGKGDDKASVIFTDGTRSVVDIEMDDEVATLMEDKLEDRKSSTVNMWFRYDMDGETYVLNEIPYQIINGDVLTGDETTGYPEISSSYNNLEFKDWALLPEDNASTEDVDENTVATADAEEEYGFKFGNAESVFITVDAENTGTSDTPAWIIDDVTSVVTGIKNVSIEPYKVNGANVLVNSAAGEEVNVFALFNNKGYITYAVVLGEESSSNATVAFVTSDNVVNKKYINDTTRYVYTYDAIVNGEMSTIEVKSAAAKSIAANTLYKLTFDSNGYVKDMETIIVKREAGEGEDGSVDITDETINTKLLKDEGHAAIYMDDAEQRLKNLPEGTDITVDDVAVGSMNLTLKGGVLYIHAKGDKASANSSYIVLDDECTFWVMNDDETEKDANEEWESFTNGKAALAELGTNGVIDNGVMGVVADKTTGYATCIMIYDTVYANNLDDESEEGSDVEYVDGVSEVEYDDDNLDSIVTTDDGDDADDERDPLEFKNFYGTIVGNTIRVAATVMAVDEGDIDGDDNMTEKIETDAGDFLNMDGGDNEGKLTSMDLMKLAEAYIENNTPYELVEIVENTSDDGTTYTATVKSGKIKYAFTIEQGEYTATPVENDDGEVTGLDISIEAMA